MDNDINEKLNTALKYQALGLSIIPTGPDKRPLIEWKRYQTEIATSEQIKKWWRDSPNANPALVTGAISKIVVLDIDVKHNRTSKEFPTVPTGLARSGNGGEHLYFKHPGFRVETKSAVFGDGVDVRGDGGYILLPSSVNDKGGLYEWIVPIEDGLADMPDWFLEKISKPEKKWLLGMNGVGEGSRNDTASSMAGKILSTCPKELWDDFGWEHFCNWNNKNTPPLTTVELKNIWESIKKYQSSQQKDIKGARTSQADELVKLIRENKEVTLFRSELDEPFICFPVGSHKEYWSCKDKRTKWWLSREYFLKHEKSPNSDAINTALNTLQGFATFEGDKFSLSNRVALKDGEIYYSLSNDNWEAVRITPNNWTIENNPPILFRRHTHQVEQVTPVRGGDIKCVFKYVNIKSEEHKVLFLVWLVSIFIPDFPHPILYLYGPQGSAKSTTSRTLKKISDPSKIETFEISKDQKELVQKLHHHWCLMFDNISHISGELSDLLCRAVTGSGFSKRELYSDDSDIIYTFKRCMSINGVNLLALKPDLLERSILIELDRVSKKDRKNEQDLLREFNRDLPELLGAIFDIVVSALASRSSVELKETPRMADFALWGCSIAEALGYGGDTFIKAYFANINLQHEEVVNESLIASFIVQLMSEQSFWEGSATELLKQMKSASPDKESEFPKTANNLSRQLNVLKTNLEELGILIERISGSSRKVIIRKKDENVAPTALVSTDIF